MSRARLASLLFLALPLASLAIPAHAAPRAISSRKTPTASTAAAPPEVSQTTTTIMSRGHTVGLHSSATREAHLTVLAYRVSAPVDAACDAAARRALESAATRVHEVIGDL